MSDNSKTEEVFTNATGAPVPDNTNILTAGARVRLYSRTSGL
jgi:catalase